MLVASSPFLLLHTDVVLSLSFSIPPITLGQLGARSEAEDAYHLGRKLWPLLRQHTQPATSPAAGAQDYGLFHQLLV